MENNQIKRKKMALGRGLDALIPSIEIVDSNSGNNLEHQKGKDYMQCDIDLIHPNRYQPRRRFSENELSELSESIKEQGILQPLLVRKDVEGYELIAGERRLRAAKMAGLDEVPIIVKDISDTDLLEMSIVENIQRQDLNPLEESEAYFMLMNEFKLTQEEVAQRVGKSRSSVANFLRLKQLPDDVKETILNGTLSMGHARALLGAENPLKLNEAFKIIISKCLSVRETEVLIKRLNSEQEVKEKINPSSEDIHFLNLSQELSHHIGTKVQIRRKGTSSKGKVEIEYYNGEDLDRLINRLKQI